MKRKFTILFTLLAPLALFAQSVITGVWENKHATVAIYKVVNGQTVEVAQAIPNEKGEFGFVVFNQEPGFYQIGLTPQRVVYNYTFYLKPNDHFSAAFKLNKVTLTGNQNSLENKEMARWQHGISEMEQVAFYAGNATYIDFFPLLTDAMAYNRNFTVSGVDAAFAEKFAAYRRNRLMYTAMNFLYTPHSSHPKEADMPGFYADFSLKALDNSVLELPEGVRLMTLLKSSNDVALSKTLDTRPAAAAMLANNLEALSTDALKGEMIMLSAKVQKTYDDMQALKAQFIEEIKRTGIEPRFDELMVSKASLAKGETAIPFAFEDPSGKIYSLSDFEGKTVYIDVWATWCAPCRKELPYLKELHEKFKKNKNLVFVSISTDAVKDYEKWKKMIVENEMPGIQLFAGEGASDFLKNYEIKGIPRFMLIDKAGKMISANAPRPSSGEEVEALLNSLVK